MKRMTFLELAQKILRETGTPMSVEEIWQSAKNRGYDSLIATKGKTPWRTIGAYELQESFGKLFTAIDTDNRENLFPILSDAVMVVLKILAYINRTPYTSLNSFMSEARKFKRKPRGLDEFLRFIIEGNYNNVKKLEKYAKNLYTAIEVYFKNRFDTKIYDDDLSTIYRKQKTTKRR